MRNTKKVIAATAAVATLVGLAACGSSNDNGANKGDADKAELVFWGWDSGNSMKEILADFEKATPWATPFRRPGMRSGPARAALPPSPCTTTAVRRYPWPRR